MPDRFYRTLQDTQPKTGWICPKCQRVYAPVIPECAACNAQAKIPARTEYWPKDGPDTTAGVMPNRHGRVSDA